MIGHVGNDDILLADGTSSPLGRIPLLGQLKGGRVAASGIIACDNYQWSLVSGSSSDRIDGYAVWRLVDFFERYSQIFIKNDSAAARESASVEIDGVTLTIPRLEASEIWTTTVPLETDPIPEIGDHPSSQAILAVTMKAADPKLQMHVTDKYEYEAFRFWADAVKDSSGIAAGHDAVMDAPYSWLSFAVDSERLITTLPGDEDLEVDGFKPISTGVFDFTVKVKDVTIGQNAVAERLSAVFGLEGGSSLRPGDMSADKVDVTFGKPENGKVKFTAGPKEKTQPTFFMRVRLMP